MITKEQLDKLNAAFRAHDLAKRDLEQALRALCSELGVEPGEPGPAYWMVPGSNIATAVNVPQLQPAVGGWVKR